MYAAKCAIDQGGIDPAYAEQGNEALSSQSNFYAASALLFVIFAVFSLRFHIFCPTYLCRQPILSNRVWPIRFWSELGWILQLRHGSFRISTLLSIFLLTEIVFQKMLYQWNPIYACFLMSIGHRIVQRGSVTDRRSFNGDAPSFYWRFR